MPSSADKPKDPREDDPNVESAQPIEAITLVPISDIHPDRQVWIGTQLSSYIKTELIAFLREHAHVFAWSYAHMPDISTEVISHKLTLYPSAHPVRQKRRAYDEENYRAIQLEVFKLQKMEFIGEINYPTWLSNVVIDEVKV